MVTQFIQTLLGRNPQAAARASRAAPSDRPEWEDEYDRYIPPPSASRENRPASQGAGPGTRRWLVQMWMETLPDAVRPVRLFADYEQIAFTLALNWGEQRDLQRYMHQLIFSSENARWCFSPEVFQELVRLDKYVDEMRAIDLTLEPLLASPAVGTL